MSNSIFPTLAGLKWPMKKTPIWSSLSQSAPSQREVRIGLVSYPLYEIELGYEFLREGNGLTEAQSLIGFFNARRGDWDDFLLTDPDDNTATSQQFGTGDGSTKTFQLYRTYAGVSEPVFGNPTVTQVTVNGTPTAVTSTDWGRVTFATAPASGAVLRWTGTFYWRVHFARPSQEFAKFLKDLWEARTVKFRTVKA